MADEAAMAAWDMDDDPEDQMGRDRDDEPTVEFEVEILKETDKAWLCVFEDGTERFVPKSQIVSWRGGEAESMEKGEEGTLAVTQWIVDQWEDEPGEKFFEVKDAVVLRATDKGIQVKAPSFPGDQRLWLPRKGVPRKSKVQEDGDSGTMLLYMWCAESKGLVEKPASAQRDLFGGGGGEHRKRPDPDDDIPF